MIQLPINSEMFCQEQVNLLKLRTLLTYWRPSVQSSQKNSPTGIPTYREGSRTINYNAKMKHTIWFQSLNSTG